MRGSNLRLDALIKNWEPLLREQFLRGIYELRASADIEQIIRMLEKGDIEGAVKAIGLDPMAFRDYTATLRNAYSQGGRFAEASLPAVRDSLGFLLEVKFDVRNPRAEAWLQNQSSVKVVELIGDQRRMIRNRLRIAMERGDNPKTAALDLVGRQNKTSGRREGGVIGLTENQDRWVQNYEAELRDPKTMRQAMERKLHDRRFNPTINRAIKDGKPIPTLQRLKMIKAYRNRALRYRAETIGRTEAMSALHEAQDEAFRQAIEAGQVDPATITRTWHSAGDNKVRDTHVELNHKMLRGMSAAWETPNGRLRYPGDPDAAAEERINCRCWAEYRIDYSIGLK